MKGMLYKNKNAGERTHRCECLIPNSTGKCKRTGIQSISAPLPSEFGLEGTMFPKNAPRRQASNRECNFKVVNKCFTLGRKKTAADEPRRGRVLNKNNDKKAPQRVRSANRNRIKVLKMKSFCQSLGSTEDSLLFNTGLVNYWRPRPHSKPNNNFPQSTQSQRRRTKQPNRQSTSCNVWTELSWH